MALCILHFSLCISLYMALRGSTLVDKVQTCMHTRTNSFHTTHVLIAVAHYTFMPNDLHFSLYITNIYLYPDHN